MYSFTIYYPEALIPLLFVVLTFVFVKSLIELIP